MTNLKELEKKIPTVAGQYVQKQGHVSAVDLLMGLGWLSKENYENWRFGRVPYLEKVTQANLNRLTTAMRYFRKWAAHANLKASWTAYQTWGKGTKRPLRFSKSGNAQIELNYATHFVLTPKRAAPPAANATCAHVNEELEATSTAASLHQHL